LPHIRGREAHGIYAALRRLLGGIAIILVGLNITALVIGLPLLFYIGGRIDWSLLVQGLIGLGYLVFTAHLLRTPVDVTLPERLTLGDVPLAERTRSKPERLAIDVHENQRQRLVSAIKLEAKISCQERANAEKMEELTGDLNRELERLETEKTERHQALEGRKEQAVAQALERSRDIEQQLESLNGTVIEGDITFEPSQTPIVRAGQRVGPKARRALTEAGKEYVDRLEVETYGEQEQIAAEYDSQIEKLRNDIQEKAQKITNESVTAARPEQ